MSKTMRWGSKPYRPAAGWVERRARHFRNLRLLESRGHMTVRETMEQRGATARSSPRRRPR